MVSIEKEFVHQVSRCQTICSAARLTTQLDVTEVLVATIPNSIPPSLLIKCKLVGLQIVKPFLDTKTARKVKFVYSNDPVSLKHLTDLFENDKVEAVLRDDDFNLEEYSKVMRLDDAKFALRRKLAEEASKSSIGVPAPTVEPVGASN